ncbi:MAG: hypothetical protein ACRC8A_15470 [Microcoleaceae cyanobacterium]
MTESRLKGNNIFVMTLKSQTLNKSTSTLAITTIQPSTESLELALSQKLSQLQVEIEHLQVTIQKLKVAPVFQPPHRLMPLEERLQLHLQSLQTAKEQTKQLQTSESVLAARQKELATLQSQMRTRQAKALKAVKRLEALAQTVKRAEQAYYQVYDEFQTTARKAQQVLMEAYGGDVNLEFEFEAGTTIPGNLPGVSQFPQLAPAIP